VKFTNRVQPHGASGHGATLSDWGLNAGPTSLSGRRYLPGRDLVADECVLQTQGLTKDFRGFTAVKNVNLNIRRGSVHALIGPNGAGKTTCFNLITKFLVGAGIIITMQN
jgi:ATPase subunit of ABC transporter with duplicated ATPase domains